MRRPFVVLAAALLLQFTLIGTSHAETVEIDEAISTERGVRVMGEEVGVISSNPIVTINFDVQVIEVETKTYTGGEANAEDPNCTANDDPTGEQTVNRTVVATLAPGAEGDLRVAVDYTETHSDGTVHKHVVWSYDRHVGPVGASGGEIAVPVCLFKS